MENFKWANNYHYLSQMPSYERIRICEKSSLTEYGTIWHEPNDDDQENSNDNCIAYSRCGPFADCWSRLVNALIKLTKTRSGQCTDCIRRQRRRCQSTQPVHGFQDLLMSSLSDRETSASFMQPMQSPQLADGNDGRVRKLMIDSE